MEVKEKEIQKESAKIISESVRNYFKYPNVDNDEMFHEAIHTVKQKLNFTNETISIVYDGFSKKIVQSMKVYMKNVLNSSGKIERISIIVDNLPVAVCNEEISKSQIAKAINVSRKRVNKSMKKRGAALHR